MDQIDIKILQEENKRLKERYKLLEQKERIIRVINNFATSILEQDSVDDILWAIAKNAIAKLGFVDCVVYLVDQERQVLVQKAAHGPKNPVDFEIINKITIPIGEGVVGNVAKTGIPELISDTTKDERYIVDDAIRLSELAVPIVLDNKVIGVIDSEHPEKNFFTSEHLQILTTISLMSATRIMNAIAKESLKVYQSKLEHLVEQRTKELNGVINQLKNSNHDLEQYAYAASHDLQEPLRTISNFLQLIVRREKNLSDESKEFMEYAIDGSQRMKKMLEGLLDYSRVDSKSYPLEAFDLNKCLNNILRSLRYRIEETSAKIIIKQELPTVNGYGVLLEQLFQNLIANSLKFRKKDTPISIEIDMDDSNVEFYHFKIKDNGIGIKSEYLDKIFNLFIRLHTQQDYKGSGIGLSLCKRIVEKHGGTIKILSDGLETGTTVEFSLKK